MTRPAPRTSTRRAVAADRDAVAALFDAYRVFYEASSDISAARMFIRERLTRNDSVIFITEENDGDRASCRDHARY